MNLSVVHKLGVRDNLRRSKEIVKKSRIVPLNAITNSIIISIL